MQKRWNVMVVPSAPGQRVFNFDFSLRSVYVVTAAFLSTLILIITIALFVGHNWKKEKSSQISQLQAELDARDAEVSRLNKEFSVLEELEGKLRAIAGLKPREHSNLNGSGGQGGPEDLSDDEASWIQVEPDEMTNEERGQLSVQDLLEGSLRLKDGFSEVLSIFESETARLSCVPSINPVDSQDAWISSGFGRRADPFTGKKRFHDGCDIVAPRGTSVIAPADGIVVFAGWRDGLGRMVEIEHGYGYITTYGHAQKLFVKKGDLVKRGDLLAQVGSSGRSTGPHLHYEVHLDGSLVNPYKYLVQ